MLNAFTQSGIRYIFTIEPSRTSASLIVLTVDLHMDYQASQHFRNLFSNPEYRILFRNNLLGTK